MAVLALFTPLFHVKHVVFWLQHKLFPVKHWFFKDFIIINVDFDLKLINYRVEGFDFGVQISFFLLNNYYCCCKCYVGKNKATNRNRYFSKSLLIKKVCNFEKLSCC